jgi:hypothetical protein
MTADKTARKQRGRPFAKGVSGNPAGRPQGSRHKVSLLVESMLAGEAEALAATALQCAKAGDATLLKALLDRVAPPRREPTLTIELPGIQSAADTPAIAARLIAAVAAGELSPSEAQSIAGLLEHYRRQVELADIEARLRALEDVAGAR